MFEVESGCNTAKEHFTYAQSHSSLPFELRCKPKIQIIVANEGRVGENTTRAVKNTRNGKAQTRSKATLAQTW